VGAPEQVGTEEYRQFPRWELVFGAAYALGLVLVWSASYTPLGARVVVSALLVALAAWWWGLGRRAVLDGDETGWRGNAYLLGVLLLFAPAAALVPQCTWVLFGLCPQPYLLRPPKVAVVWVAAYNAVPPLVGLWYGRGSGTFAVQLVIAVGVTVFSYVIGTNITRISAQSRERAELIRELEASRAKVAALSREAGVTAERERLAAEIHDTLAQGFTSILTLVQAAIGAVGRDDGRVRRHLDLAAETARENLAEARALVGALAPVALDTASLTEALRRQAKRVSEECGVAVECETVGELGALGTPTQVVVLRVVQEALANVRRHAGARTASVRLARRDGTVVVTVADDGQGFDPDAVTRGFGLRGIRSRVEQIGGTVHVDSGPAGTVLRLELPA
jgi:signal transduction histidine kinase